jgi:hypothetical protein
MSTTLYVSVSSEQDLRTAIATAATATAGTTVAVTLTADITLTADLPPLALPSGVTFTLDGTAANPATIEGNGFAGFVVEGGTAAFSNLILEGFDGTAANDPGGALTVDSGASSTTDNVVFTGGRGVLADVAVQGGGALAVTGGSFSGGSPAALAGNGALTLEGGVVLNGALATGGPTQILGSATLAATGSVSGAIYIGTQSAPATLTLTAYSAANFTALEFSRVAGNVLAFTHDATPRGPIFGFGLGETIDLLGFGLVTETTFLDGVYLEVASSTQGTEFMLDYDVTAAGYAVHVAPDAVGTGTDLTVIQTAFTVASEADLDAALATIDLGGASAEPSGAYKISLTQGFTLSGDLDAIDLAAGASLTIDGGGSVLDSGGHRGLFAYAGKVTIENLTIRDAQATGGAGGTGTIPGGGGAGLGGGLFVASGASVTLSDVNFIGDGAIGGAGGTVAGSDIGAAAGSAARAARGRAPTRPVAAAWARARSAAADRRAAGAPASSSARGPQARAPAPMSAATAASMAAAAAPARCSRAAVAADTFRPAEAARAASRPTAISAAAPGRARPLASAAAAQAPAWARRAVGAAAARMARPAGSAAAQLRVLQPAAAWAPAATCLSNRAAA